MDLRNFKQMRVTVEAFQHKVWLTFEGRKGERVVPGTIAIDIFACFCMHEH